MRRVSVVPFLATLVVALVGASAPAGASGSGDVSGPAGDNASTGLAAGPAGRVTDPAGPRPVAATVHTLPLAGEEQVAAAGLTAVPQSSSSASSSVAVLTREVSTSAFQTLGVTWRTGKAPVDVLVRVRTHSAKGWSAWQELDGDVSDDPAAAARAVRGGTNPLWVGPSDGVQARVTARSGTLPEDLRLDLVDPGSSPYDARISASGGFSAASANKPAIVTRAQWGADESRIACPPEYAGTVKAAVMHHTAGPNSYSAGQVAGILRGDYAYHLSRGWCDIGYNALVDKFGRIWEGRAGGLDRAVIGAHAGGFNVDTFGVSVIGNYDVARPSTAAVNAVARVMAWKLDLDHRDPFGSTKLTSLGGGTARYPKGRTVSFPVVMGHRNTGYTACPGRYLYSQLGYIRSRVRTLMKASLVNPIVPASTVTRGTKVSFGARTLVKQSWRLDVDAPFGRGRVARITGSASGGTQIKPTWDGRIDGSPARPGRYTLTLTSSSSRGTARPVTRQVLVVPKRPQAEEPAVPSSGSGGFYPLTPTRLLDTYRNRAVGLGPDGRVDVAVLGQAGVPTVGVSSVVLNVTARRSSDDTTISVWPTGRRTVRPLTGVPAGVTRSALVTSRVGGDGSVSVGNARGVVEVAVDVVGYFAEGGSALRPVRTRLYDTRAGLPGALVPGQERTVPLPGSIGPVPSSEITGLVVDVSALSAKGTGTLTAYSSGTAGNLPTLNYRARESIDNLAFVPVRDGTVTLRATGAQVDAVLDVRAVLVTQDGSALSPSFRAVKPALAVDTQAKGGSLGPGEVRKVVVTGTRTGVPSGASAVVVNLNAVDPTAGTWLRAYPWAGTAGSGTALRIGAHDTRGNLALVPIGPGGAIALFNSKGKVRVRVDVYGYLD